ncbi:Ubiquitin-conjugating enzyme E2 19 [Bienertia sinuspersici]
MTMNGGYSDNTPTATPAVVPAKQNVAASKTVDTQSVLKRLQSELMSLMMNGDPGISAFPEEDNIFSWKGTIHGSKDTVFEGTEYKLSLTFPADYPFKPPKDKWSSAYDVSTILLSIQSLLGEPNTTSPLNTQAAALWSNQEEYRKMVEKLYNKPSTT